MTCARGRRSSQSTPSVGSSRARTWTLRQMIHRVSRFARARSFARSFRRRARAVRKDECTFQRFVYRASSRASRARTHRDGRSRGSISAMSSRARRPRPTRARVATRCVDARRRVSAAATRRVSARRATRALRRARALHGDRVVFNANRAAAT